MKQSSFNPETILALDDSYVRQEALIDAFNQAIEQEDYSTARHIAELSIGGGAGKDELNFCTTVSFKADIWHWLYAYLRGEYRLAEDDSDEEQAYWDACLETLWKGKWIIDGLATDLSLSRTEIEQHSNKIQACYEELDIDSSLHRAYLEQSIKMGDMDAARQRFEKWQANEDDKFADCKACQQDTLIRFSYFIGDYAKAVELAEPILNGTMSCGEVPHTSYYSAIYSLIQLGRIEEAKVYLAEAVTLISSEIEQFSHIMPKLAQLYTLLGDSDRAIELLKTHQEIISKVVSVNLLDLLEYLIALAPYSEEAQQDARCLAKDLDERNGNRYYQLKLEMLFLAPQSVH